MVMYSSASCYLASASRKLASWPQKLTAYIKLINIHNVGIDVHCCSHGALVYICPSVC